MDSSTQIIADAKAGKASALAILIKENQNFIFNLAIKMLQNQFDAEEVTQDVFIKMYQNLQSYNGDAKFSTWLYKIAYNSCLDKIRANKSHNFTELSEHVSVENNSLEKIEKNEENSNLMENINKLDPKYKSILILFYFGQLSYQEIADISSESLANVKILLFRAKALLKVNFKHAVEG
jgi:RNA polymerase sigma factor (sigma-70 family)